jgi:hypothetical protein
MEGHCEWGVEICSGLTLNSPRGSVTESYPLCLPLRLSDLRKVVASQRHLRPLADKMGRERANWRAIKFAIVGARRQFDFFWVVT